MLSFLLWTREALTSFPYSIILWITQDLETAIITKAPDFWIWRKGVFRFIFYPRKIINSNNIEIKNFSSTSNKEKKISSSLESWKALVKQIEESKGDKEPSLIPLYNQIGKIYKTRLEQGETNNYQEDQEATALNNLGLVYYAQGNYEQAEFYLKQALTLRKHLLGNTHLDVAGSLNNLAKLYIVLFRYPEAEALYQDALAICEETLGTDHPITLKIQTNLKDLKAI